MRFIAYAVAITKPKMAHEGGYTCKDTENTKNNSF